MGAGTIAPENGSFNVPSTLKYSLPWLANQSRRDLALLNGVVINSFKFRSVPHYTCTQKHLDTSPLHEEHRRIDPHGLMDGRLNTEHLLDVKLGGECSHIASESELIKSYC